MEDYVEQARENRFAVSKGPSAERAPSPFKIELERLVAAPGDDSAGERRLACSTRPDEQDSRRPREGFLEGTRDAPLEKRPRILPV